MACDDIRPPEAVPHRGAAPFPLSQLLALADAMLRLMVTGRVADFTPGGGYGLVRPGLCTSARATVRVLPEVRPMRVILCPA
jgi:hypothetical protein